MVGFVLGLMLQSAIVQGDDSVPAATQPTVTSRPSSDLAGRLVMLRHAPFEQAGRGNLLRQYEDLIAQAGNDPVAAEAMIDLAGLLESRGDSQRDPNLNQAMKWYRRAADESSPLSQAYATSRFCIAWRVEYSDPTQARTLLDEITAHANGNTLLNMQVQTTLIGIAVRQGKLDEAEEHARNVLRDYIATDDQTVKDKMDGMMASAADAIIDAWVPAALSLQDRSAKIQSLMNDFPAIGAVQSAGTDALKQLQNTQQAQTN